MEKRDFFFFILHTAANLSSSGGAATSLACNTFVLSIVKSQFNPKRKNLQK